MTELRQWDLSETKRLVVEIWGEEQLLILRPVMRAVGARLTHARYHYKECRRLVAEHVEERLIEPLDIFSIMFPSGHEEMDRMNDFYVQFEAHMLACAQAIHATADILAHFVYFALGLNRGERKIEEANIKLGTVIRHLQCGVTDRLPSLLPVRQQLATLKNSNTFKDISDVVNHAKHRGGPGAALVIAPTEDKVHKMQVDAFYRGQYRPARDVEEVLAPAFQVVNEAVVDIGIAVIQYLRSIPRE